MLSKTTQASEWPIIENVIAPLAGWWRRHATIRDSLNNIDALGADEMARMAQDVGLSASDLRALAAHWTDAADLLDRRLAALGLNTDQLAQTAAAELRDMERLCTLCESKGRCARDLTADPNDPVWRQYCPNETVLTELARAKIEH